MKGIGLMGGLGFGIMDPWMLFWLAAALVPIVLAWLAMRRPRPVRFGATEFVARAARRQHVTRGGVSLPLTALRMAAVAVAALAAARPFTTAIHRPNGAADSAGPRLECVVDDAGGDHDGTRDLRRVLEALGRPRVTVVTPAAAGRDEAAASRLFILGDGTIPAAADARRIATAVSDGASVLVCIGPRSMAEPVRERLRDWLGDLAGITLSGGPQRLSGAGIVVAPAVAPVRADATGFVPLPGPTVDMVAPLMVAGVGRGEIGPPTVLARTMPEGLPLLLESRRGRGAVCVAAVPLALPERSLGEGAGPPWSNLAAWPEFVPLVDRLVDRLLATSVSAARTAGPQRVPLWPPLVALACGLLLADWALSAAMSGAGRGAQAACRAVAALGWLLVGFGMGGREPARADPGPTDPPRGIVVVLDRSPSMGRLEQGLPGPLERAVAALVADDRGAGPLARLARSRPVDLVTAAADTAVLGRWGREVTAGDLEALAPVAPASRSSRIGDAVADVVRGAVTGSRPASIVVVSDGAITAGRDWSEASSLAREAGVPLVVIPAVGAADGPAPPAEAPARRPASDPIRVLLVDSGPRFEWRFLERALEADAGFTVQTCFLAPPDPAARGGHALPGTVAEWNAFDVVVLGDVPLAPSGTGGAERHDRAWLALAEAASADGLGIAWSPAARWWRDAAPAPTWLPVAPAGARESIGSYRLRMRAGEATAAWLPREPVDAVVYAVLRPVTLAPTARVLAAAVPAVAAATDAEPVPAIVVDRLGAGTVLAHLCETWRWSGINAAAYGAYWRGLLRRLAEPHRLGARLVATLDVAPRAAEVGRPVRVEAASTRAGVDLAGWQLEITGANAPGPDRTGRRVPLVPAPARRGTMTAVIDGLAAGPHAVRLVPPADQAAPPAAELPAIEIVMVEPVLEEPGGGADIGPLVDAARDSAGAVVPVDDIATLPSVVAALVPAGDPAGASGGEAGFGRWLLRRGAAHAAMLASLVALVAAWWPASRGHGRASA